MACVLTTSTPSIVPIADGPGTLCGWYYRTAGVIITRAILNNGHPGLNGWGMYTAAGAGSGFGILIGGVSLGTNVAMTAGQWNHLMLIRNNAGNSDYRLYLNGTLVRTENWTANATGVPSNIFEGSALLNVAEVGIWNVVLTAVEITALAKGFSPRRIRPQSLRGWVPMRDGTYKELTGRFTLTGAPTNTPHPRIYP